MLIHELLNEDLDIVPEEAPLIVLDSKSAMCMAKNGKYTKHTRHIERILGNGYKCKMHIIDWSEGGLRSHRFIDLSIVYKSGLEFCSTQVSKVFSESW